MFFACQSNFDKQLNEFRLNEKKIYLVFRGTDTKEGFFAKDFNIKDTLSSHVGFALSKNSKWEVCHILENNNQFTDFNIETLEEFINKKDDSVYYFSFWEINNLNIGEVEILKNTAYQYKTKKIKFDKHFSDKDSLELYCSEFINKVLNKVNPNKYNFKFHKKELKGIYKVYFKKDTLEYYPVDMFQYNSSFTKIFEWLN